MNSPLRDAVDGATICAISTAPGAGGIAVVRISGSDALALGSKVFSKPLDSVADRSVAFGRFRDAEDTVLDEGLALVLRGPGSYTGEDTVEFNIHGSQFIQREVMRALIEAGCRQAGPGEFTQRAFVNGRLDLTQAEAVADLIAAEHAGAHRLALDQLRGGFAREINALREALIGFAGLLELELDFAEEDVEFADRERFDALLADLLSRVTSLADSFATGNAMKEGIPVAIVGAPNRGKSTLLNALLGDDRAIVSDIPGTTRDTVEDACTLDGLRFRFIDTAGLRDTDDVVEAEGIRRAMAKASSASTVLLLLDASTDANEDVQARIDDLDLAPEAHVIVVWNKCDLAPAPLSNLTGVAVLSLSASTGEGLDDLRKELLRAHRADDHGHRLVVTNLRHFEALSSAKDALQSVRHGLGKGVPGDLVAVDVRQALHHLGEITGAVHADDILGHIFSHFCIGK
jgi:tRNA modification GTPase